MRRGGCFVLFIMLVAAAAQAAPADAARVSVEIEAPVAGNEAPLARLREQLAARLLEEGFAVVPEGGDAEIVLRLAPRAPGWLLRAVVPTETLEREVADCAVERAEERLVLVQKATELARKALHARAVSEAALPPGAASPAGAAPPAAAAPSPAPASSSPAPAVTLREARRPVAEVDVAERRVPAGRELSAGAGVLAQGTELQPLARLAGRAALGPRLGLDVALGMTGATTAYRLLEEQALVGLSGRLAAGGGLWFDAGAEVGLLVHEYRAIGGSGWATVPDEVALLTFRSGLAMAPHLGLELSVAAGLRTHDARPQTPESWATSGYLVQGGLGVIVY